MDDYSEYFSNILSRSWLGQKRDRTSTSIEKSNITDIYIDIVDDDKIIIVGKTEKFYFILECYDSEGYYYSNGLFNDDLIELISSYKNKNSITGGRDVKSFVPTLVLKNKLDKELAVNSVNKSIKSRKI